MNRQYYDLYASSGSIIIYAKPELSSVFLCIEDWDLRVADFLLDTYPTTVLPPLRGDSSDQIKV